MTKRYLCFVLAFVMCISMCACGNSSVESETTELETTELETTEFDPVTEPAITKLNIGETASTDMVEFTLESSALTYYVSNVSSTYLEPTETPNTTYGANVGDCFISLTFTIHNKNRAGSILFPNHGEHDNTSWKVDWTVNYNGTEYAVKGEDLGYFSIKTSAWI